MTLTPEQRSCLWDAANHPYYDLRIISARPGTGKTSAVAAYCGALIQAWDEKYASWQGIALLSFTNVATREISAKLDSEDSSLPSIGYPHFTGTIDAFVNRYVFLPHGASAAGARSRARMVGEPHSQWVASSGIQYDNYFEHVNYQLDGTLTFNTAELARRFGRRTVDLEKHRKSINAAKRKLNRLGLATQQDANYFAYRTLTDSPRIAKSLIQRFPVFIIDEAQDMTEIQHAIIDLLVGAGLRHCVLIGDERQAIYEWNTSRPILFYRKVQEPGWNNGSICGSFRCSPAICVALNSLSHDDDLRPCPTSKNEQYSDKVLVTPFSRNHDDARTRIRGIIDEFCKSLSTRPPHNARSKCIEVAVLARGTNEVGDIRALYLGDTVHHEKPISFSNPRTTTFLRLVNHVLGGQTVRAFHAYEKILFSLGEYDSREDMRKTLSDEWSATMSLTYNYRRTIAASLIKIKTTLGAISARHVCVHDCGALCSHNLVGLGPLLNEIAPDLQESSSRRRPHQQERDLPLTSILTSGAPKYHYQHSELSHVRLTFSTVHGVKGETFDGVLYVIKAQTNACGCNSSSNRTSRIAQHDILQCESNRIHYVAMSRAAQSLRLAVEADQASWERLVNPAQSHGNLKQGSLF